nr:immunoglobulin light chain junction region [Macaca mulatta]
CGQGSYWPYSF